MKMLDGVVRFPCDAESNSFFGALASALAPAPGIAEATPFYCSPHGGYCRECGGCGKTAAQRHQLALYHALITATGAALCFGYPEDDGAPYRMSGAPLGWRWPDGFVSSALRAAGRDFSRLMRGADKRQVYRAIAGSIDAGRPVPVRIGGADGFSGDAAWQLITGYDDGALLGLDPGAQSPDGRFAARDWYAGFCDAIIIGESAEPAPYAEMLERMAGVLAHESNARCERDVYAMLDSACGDNAAEVAGALCDIAGVAAEARWHAAEAMCSKDNLLTRMPGGDGLRDELAKLFFERYIAGGSGETHGTCFEIWGLIGAEAKNGFRPAEDAAERLMDARVRAGLKRLFARVFDNDRAVLEGIRQALERANPNADMKI